MDKTKLQVAIEAFIRNEKANIASSNGIATERKERKDYYRSFNRKKLLALSEEQFTEYIRTYP